MTSAPPSKPVFGMTSAPPWFLWIIITLRCESSSGPWRFLGAFPSGCPPVYPQHLTAMHGLFRLIRLGFGKLNVTAATLNRPVR